jgi:hypothetical protein
MLLICGIGIFAGNHRKLLVGGNGAAAAEARFSIATIEAELRAAYPEFSGAINIEVGLARTTSNSSILELTVTDRSGNRYVCLLRRTASGWKIQRTNRLKIAFKGIMT